MSDDASAEVLSWMEFKIFKQYPAFGNMLEELKIYGYRGVRLSKNQAGLNSHRWITEEPALNLPENVYFAGIFAKNR